MKNLRDVVIDNLLWIITTLVAVGIFVATVKYQGEALAGTTALVNTDRIRIENLEKSIVRLEMIQCDIKEIKEDLREIKKIVLKPAFGVNDVPNSVVALR